MTPSDRRRHPRYSLQVPAILLVPPDARPMDGARLMDLSEGGAFLVIPAQARAGHAIHLQLRAPEASPASAMASAAGRVVRVLPFGAHSSGVAVAFHSVNSGLRAFLHALAQTPEPQRPAFVDTLSEVLIRLTP